MLIGPVTNKGMGSGKGTEGRAPTTGPGGPLLVLGRRSLLRLSAGAAGAIAAGALLPACSAPPPPAERFAKLGFFSPAEGYVLECLAARILPAHRGRPTVEEIELVVRLDEEIGWLAANADRSLGGDFRNLLRLVEYGPFFIGFLFAPFTRLDYASRDVFLHCWERHRVATLRMAFRNLRALCAFFYFCDQRTWASIHYAGPWLSGGRERLARWRAAIT